MFLKCWQTTTSAPLRAACAVPGPLASTRLVASTVNAPKVSPWTQRASSVKVSSSERPTSVSADQAAERDPELFVH